MRYAATVLTMIAALAACDAAPPTGERAAAEPAISATSSAAAASASAVAATPAPPPEPSLPASADPAPGPAVASAPPTAAPRAPSPGGGPTSAPPVATTPSATPPPTPVPTAAAPAASSAPRGEVTTGASFSAYLAGGTFDAGKPGAAQVVVQALGPYHVNAEYPYKFTLDPPPPGLTYPETTIRRVSRSETRATMPVAFTAAAPGSYRISGTCALSVCTPNECIIKKVPLAVSVVVR